MISRGDLWQRIWFVALAATLVSLTVAGIVGRLTAEPMPPGRPAAAAQASTGPSADLRARGPGVSGEPRAWEPGVSGEPRTGEPNVSGEPRTGEPGVSGEPRAGVTDRQGEPWAGATGPRDRPGGGVAGRTGEPAMEPLAADVLQLAGKVPVKGTGDFQFSGERGPVAGAKGTLSRFKVAVEKGSGEDVAEFAAQVQAVLTDERSWTGSGRVRLQMVSGSDKADFTVYLATRDTAGRMCARGGIDIRVGGVPFTSCRTSGKAIINLDRWRRSATPYLAAKAGLAEYRRYVINHEVGHELGHRHQGCPQAGGPAPVMVQQTLTLRGCTPYAWPRRKNKDLAGPRF